MLFMYLSSLGGSYVLIKLEVTFRTVLRVLHHVNSFNSL